MLFTEHIRKNLLMFQCNPQHEKVEILKDKCY